MTFPEMVQELRKCGELYGFEHITEKTGFGKLEGGKLGNEHIFRCGGSNPSWTHCIQRDGLFWNQHHFETLIECLEHSSNQ